MTVLRSRHLVPAFSLLLGVVMGAAALHGGSSAGTALGFLGVMVALAVVLEVGGRFQALAVMRSPRTDERYRTIDRDATAFAGLVLVTAIIAAFLWEIAHGRDGSPYAGLGAIGGAAYLIAVVVVGRRG